MYLGGNKMLVTNLHDLITLILIIFISTSTGYTRAQSDSWKEWLNGFFE